MSIFSYNSRLYKIVTNKKIWLYLFLSFIPIIYKKGFEQLVDEYIVNLIYSNIESSHLSLFLLIVIIISSCIFILRIKNSYIISKDILFLSFVIFFWTLCYHIDNTKWQFAPFWNSPIPQVSVVYLIFFFNVVLYLKDWINKILNTFRKKQSADSEKVGFFVDMPIKKIDGDDLSRKEYAKNISKKIINGIFEKALAIGITGNWGSGKTSFINLIKLNIESETDKPIIIEFNPWNSPNKEQIVNDFFETFRDTLKPYSSELSNQILSYGKDLVELDNSIWSNLSEKVIDFFNENNTIEEKYNQIDKTLQKLNKKIVIFIDDLDRLSKPEVIEVIKIIRNTGNFYNTCFVVAYDREYVIKAIEDFNPHQSAFFLEKIFQVEIPLPILEQGIIKDRLVSKLELLFPNIEKKKIESAFEYKDEFRSDISPLPLENFIPNIRDINRYCNSLILHIDKIEHEVEIIDFLRLELIRYKYPKVLNYLFQNRKKYLNEEGENQDHFFYSLDDSFKEYLNNNKNDFAIDKSKVDSIVELLSWLFFNPMTVNLDRRKTINNSRYFYSYFLYQIPSNIISYKTFEESLKQPKEDFFKQIEKWVTVDNKSSDLRWKLKEYSDYKSQEEFKNVVEGIFYYNSIPSKKEYIHVYYSDKDLESKLFFNNKHNEGIFATTLNKALTNFFTEKEYKNYILSFFENIDDFYFYKSNFLRFLSKKEDDSTFILDKATRIKITIDYFEHYLKISDKLNFSTFWRLYNNTKSTVLDGDSRYIKEELPKRRNDLIKKYITEETLKNFLEILIQYTTIEKGYYQISPEVTEIFGSYDDFYQFINRFNKTDFLKEFLTFYEKLKNEHFKGHVEFYPTHLTLKVADK